MSAPSRSMTPGERILATTVYKSQINFDLVTIFNKKWSVFQSVTRAMAPNGNIYYPDGHPGYNTDFSSAAVDIHRKATFIHELAHVWQHQQGLHLVLIGAFQREYNYHPLTTHTIFSSLGIEQQAQIIRDYFYLLNNHTGKAPDGTAWPTIDVYIDVIPFLP